MVRHSEMMIVMGSQEVIAMATTVRIAMVTTVRILAVGTSTSSLTREKVEELLLDQRILFKMRLRTVKLEIQPHVTSECTRLREFIVVIVAPPAPTTAPGSRGANVEVDV
ncbi:Hypothetical predicted protein [Olea europaea subsp. europaea]|uniref:Uncharacterized protein n=1 Tax=Olea europaea subsp. europaea TaxID=158383 RepID=A0A8S0UHR3_OLEEU|nr:Hypothetical predicted protein [Olea europaea subsp. europaea]